MAPGNKVALVVGASRGIGRQIAIDLGKHSHRVIVAAKTVSNPTTCTPFPPDPNSSSSTINTVAREITEAGNEAIAIAVDTRSYESIQGLVDETIRHYGRLDVLVYNSGAIWWASVENTPMKRFQLMQKINPEGLYGTVQACLPHFKANGWKGRIIVVSPPIYSRFFRGKTAYAMGKIGMSVLTKGLAMDFEREQKTDMAITSIWPATGIESAATAQISAREPAEGRDLRKPTIFSDAILAILKAPISDVNGLLDLDEDFLRRHSGITEYSHYSCVDGASPRRIMPRTFPTLLVDEQTDEGKKVDKTVLMNPKVPLDVFLPPEEYSDIHLLATADGNGVNAGAFFIKVHPWSVGLLEAVVSFPLYRPHIDLEHYDQTALKELLRDKEFRHNYMFAPQRWFNAYVKELYDSRRPWQMNPGDLLVHFPNLPHNQDEMWVLLDRSQMHLREFEVEYESTTYSKEIPEFWASQHDKQITQKGEAREAAKDADVLLKRTTSQLKMHRNDMNQEDTGNIEQQMAALRLSLREQEDNKEATMLYYQRLQQASGVLHILAAKGREALIKRAEAIMSSSKEHFKPLNDDLHEDAKKDLFGKLNLLHKLLTDSSIDDTQLLSTVEDLEL
ncbi:citronellol/citronellal dehydrogenase, partial [Lecanoromycetidae sp. Uapishka_2]